MIEINGVKLKLVDKTAEEDKSFNLCCGCCFISEDLSICDTFECTLGKVWKEFN